MWVLCMSTCWLQGGSATLKEVLGPCYGQLSSIDLDTAPEVVAVGPRQASQMLALSLNEEKEREKWLEQARVQARAWSRHWMLGTGVRLSVQAIAGSCPRSRDSVVSGLRCWFEFARCILKLPASRALPPTRKGLLAWSNLFRHQRTFANYLFLRALWVRAHRGLHGSVRRPRTAQSQNCDPEKGRLHDQAAYVLEVGSVVGSSPCSSWQGGRWYE